MRAVVVTEAGLLVKEAPDTCPDSADALVRLRGIGLNRADLAVAAGLRHGNPVGPGAIPGIEDAGEVAEHTLADRLECFEAVAA